MHCSPSISQIAIIGDGPAGLACFAALRRQGAAAETITVYGDSAHPLAALEQYARALGQKQMRSEGNGHLVPIEFPGLALVDAWRHQKLWPLLLSLVDAYKPSLETLRAHTDDLARRVTRRVARVRWQPERVLPFVLVDSADETIGYAQHIVLALGSAGLAWPSAAHEWQSHPAVAHAYHGPRFQPGAQVAVVGQGMAAAHMWIAALSAGAHVTAIHRRPLHRQTLNAPRCAFNQAWIAAYQQLSPSQRRMFHQQRRSSFPRRWSWEWTLHAARRAGRFTAVQAEIIKIAEPPDAQPGPLRLQFNSACEISADQLVCATGFQRAACAHPLIRQLTDTFDLPLADGMLCLADDFTLPQIGGPSNRCGVVGALAGWALPVGNTFVGMKYVARRLAPLLCSARVAHDYPVSYRHARSTAP